MTRNEISAKLKAVIFEFLEAPDNAKQKFVENKKEIILNPSTDRFLLELASSASYSEEAKINTFRKVLLDCGYRDIATAFTEHDKLINHITQIIQKFIAIPHLKEKKQILKENLDLLTSLGIYALNVLWTEEERSALLEGETHSARMQKVKQNGMLLIKCTEFGIDFPFWEIENNYDDYWVSQIENIEDKKEGSQMADFFVLIKSLVEQVKGLVIEEMRPEGFLLRTDIEPIGRIFISPATSDTVLFWLPEEMLLFRNKHEVPNWLPDFLEKRTEGKLAKWALNDMENGVIYNLEYMARMNDLTPKIFEKICFSTMSEKMSLAFWLATMTKIHRKPLSELNPDPIDLQLGLAKPKGG